MMPNQSGFSRIAPALSGLAVGVGELRAHPRNPRRGDLGAVKESLGRHGQYRPIVANRDGTVLAGNHVLRAACELGWDEVAVTWVDLSEGEATRVVLVDNRSSDLAGYDEELLVELLSGLGDLAGTGFDDQALEELLADVAPAPLEEGELPPPPSEPTTEPGDVYVLGRHRLVCGDAQDAGVLRRLMAGGEAAVVWTDPPYGVGYEGKTNARLRLQGDRRDGLSELLQGAFGSADGVLGAGGAVYVAHPAGALSLVFGEAFVGVGWRLRQTLVWVKDAFVLGHGDASPALSRAHRRGGAEHQPMPLARQVASDRPH
jgi:site-specific DNA-methyltransferase (adenine-specific)